MTTTPNDQNATQGTAELITPGLPLVDSATGTPTKTPAFHRLSEYIISDIEVTLRMAVYTRVAQAVRLGELPGLVHSTETVKVTVTDVKQKTVQRDLKEVLLKHTDHLASRLESMTQEVKLKHITRTGGGGYSVAQLQELGHSLDFDAIAAAAQQRHQRLRTKKAAGKKKK